MKEKAKLIKKLRLKEGCQYILFIPDGVMDPRDLPVFFELMKNSGFGGSIVVHAGHTDGIKVIEKKDEQNSSKETENKGG